MGRSAIIPLSVLWWLYCLCDCRAFTGLASPAKVVGIPCSASKNPLRLPNEPNPFDLFGVKRGTEKAEIRTLLHATSVPFSFETSSRALESSEP